MRNPASQQFLPCRAQHLMSETDRRLKDHLNASQAMRERMCLEVLSVLPGYRDVVPRLPKGGPDGGRDIQAQFNGELCYGAVGFINDASDVAEHRARIVAKFDDDLEAAFKGHDSATPAKWFLFFTNVGLTPTLIDGLKAKAKAKGLSGCDILDRERIRIALDSSKGYAIRYRYLEIPLSDAEQKDFFSTWAQGINSMVSDGLSGLDEATKRIQFLLESQMLVDCLTTVVELEDSLDKVSGGEFLFQTSLCFRTHSDGLMGYYFGGGNDPIVQRTQRKTSDSQFDGNSQYGYSFAWLLPGFPQHAKFVDAAEAVQHPVGDEGDPHERLILVGSSSAVLSLDTSRLFFESGNEPFLDRFAPTFKLIELDSCLILFACNRSLAERIASISIHANGYEMLRLVKNDLKIELGKFGRFRLPPAANKQSSEADWVVLRPNRFASNFTIDITRDTPARYNWRRK